MYGYKVMFLRTNWNTGKQEFGGKVYTFLSKEVLTVGMSYDIMLALSTIGPTEHYNPIMVLQKLDDCETLSTIGYLRGKMALICAVKERPDLLPKDYCIPAKKATKMWKDVKKVYYVLRNRTTTVEWMNGDKTTVTAQNNEEFDKEKGLAMCYVKYHYGNSGRFNDIMRNLQDDAIVQ